MLAVAGLRAPELTGARYGELCRLRTVDFDESAGLIKIATGKTGKGRTFVTAQMADR